MRAVVDSIEGEFRRYKGLAEGAIEQLSDLELVAGPAAGNSVATIVRHLTGNLRSRFIDFLTTDGEKPWRDRESEFSSGAVNRAQLLDEWQDGWKTLFDTLAGLGDEHLQQPVTIRGVSLSVVEALHRSLAHASYHVGQIVFLAKSARGAQWRYLSIAPGESSQYNANPSLEKPRR